MKVVLFLNFICAVFSRYMMVEYYAEAPTRIWSTPTSGSFTDLMVYTRSKLKKINVDVKEFSGKGSKMKTASDGYPKQMIRLSFRDKTGLIAL